MDINEIEITREMLEAVALAVLYREDATIALKQVCQNVRRPEDLDALLKRILTHPEFEEIKNDTIKLEKVTLIDDTVETVELIYNALLKEARFEKKYEVAIRILKELQKLKAISDEETKFEIEIEVEKPNGEKENTI